MKNFYNKYNNIIAIGISILALVVSITSNQSSFGAASILTTDSDDTLETFRTNVNSSLQSLTSNSLSTTTAQSWSATQSFSAIGISSTTPFGNIGIGTGLATSSVSGGKFCFYFKDEANRGMYIKLSISGNTVFSTSTTSCL